MDQNLAADMINLRSKKCWWPLFRFCIDVAVNNAYQLYKIRTLNEGEARINYLEFRRVIIKKYYKDCAKKLSSKGLLSKLVCKDHIRMTETNHHWIRKGKQRKCAKTG